MRLNSLSQAVASNQVSPITRANLVSMQSQANANSSVSQALINSGRAALELGNLEYENIENAMVNNAYSNFVLDFDNSLAKSLSYTGLDAENKSFNEIENWINENKNKYLEGLTSDKAKILLESKMDNQLLNSTLRVKRHVESERENYIKQSATNAINVNLQNLSNPDIYNDVVELANNIDDISNNILILNPSLSPEQAQVESKRMVLSHAIDYAISDGGDNLITANYLYNANKDIFNPKERSRIEHEINKKISDSLINDLGWQLLNGNIDLNDIEKEVSKMNITNEQRTALYSGLLSFAQQKNAAESLVYKQKDDAARRDILEPSLVNGTLTFEQLYTMYQKKDITYGLYKEYLRNVGDSISINNDDIYKSGSMEYDTAMSNFIELRNSTYITTENINDYWDAIIGFEYNPKYAGLKKDIYTKLSNPSKSVVDIISSSVDNKNRELFTSEISSFMNSKNLPLDADISVSKNFVNDVAKKWNSLATKSVEDRNKEMEKIYKKYESQFNQLVPISKTIIDYGILPTNKNRERFSESDYDIEKFKSSDKYNVSNLDLYLMQTAPYKKEIIKTSNDSGIAPAYIQRFGMFASDFEPLSTSNSSAGIFMIDTNKASIEVKNFLGSNDFTDLEYSLNYFAIMIDSERYETLDQVNKIVAFYKDHSDATQDELENLYNYLSKPVNKIDDNIIQRYW